MYQGTNFIIDFLFFVDIVIAFRTAYINDKGDEVTDNLKIAWNYVLSTFIIDLTATIPFDSIVHL